MPEAIFHVGLHKTATTFLQSVFFDNQQILEANGLFYPTVGIQRKAHHALAQKGKEREIQEHLQNLANELEDKEFPDILISSEELSRNPDFIASFGTAFKQYKIKILVYLRRQDLAYASRWAQSIKGKGRNTQTMDQFIDENRRVAKKLDYDQLLAEFEKILPDAEFVVRPFEKEQIKPSILHDFFNSIGRAALTEIPLEETSEKRNQSSNLLITEVHRVLNEIGIRDKVSILELQKIVDEIAPHSNPKICLSKAQQLRVLAKYEASNSKVAEKYFNSERPLFVDPIESAIEQEPLSDAEMLAIIFRLMAPLRGRIVQVENKLKKL